MKSLIITKTFKLSLYLIIQTFFYIICPWAVNCIHISKTANTFKHICQKPISSYIQLYPSSQDLVIYTQIAHFLLPTVLHTLHSPLILGLKLIKYCIRGYCYNVYQSYYSILKCFNTVFSICTARLDGLMTNVSLFKIYAVNNIV